MKRIASRALCILCALALVPAFGFGSGGLRPLLPGSAAAAELPLSTQAGEDAPEGQDAGALMAADTGEATDVTATFEDDKLYSAIVSQLRDDGDGIDFSANDDTRTVSIAAAEADKVTRLDLKYSSISNLAGIQGLTALPNLTWLDLSHNALAGSACTPLGELTQLTYLDLYENTALDDWAFLGTLTNLEHLNIASPCAEATRARR